MFREIRLGDFGGIEKNDWIELWSGVLGAIPAAVIAALVAMWVLRRSNEHQREVAADALIEQKRLAEVQLEEQKRLSNAQLAEQRAEAARIREQAAIAEVVIATERFVHSSRETPVEITGRLAILQAAVARWRVELGGGAMEEEVLEWTELVFVIALRQSKVEDESGRGMYIMASVIAGLSGLAMEWAGADGPFRERLRERSKVRRLEIAADFARFCDA